MACLQDIRYKKTTYTTLRSLMNTVLAMVCERLYKAFELDGALCETLNKRPSAVVQHSPKPLQLLGSSGVRIRLPKVSGSIRYSTRTVGEQWLNNVDGLLRRRKNKGGVGGVSVSDS